MLEIPDKFKDDPEVKRVIDRLNKEYTVTPEGCILFTGARTSSGYGEIRFKGKVWNIHRLMLHIYKDMLPDDPRDSTHSCDNRPCFNLEHLSLESRSQNERDAYARNRKERKANLGYRKKAFQCGHPFEEDNIRRHGARTFCITCEKERNRRHYLNAKTNYIGQSNT